MLAFQAKLCFALSNRSFTKTCFNKPRACFSVCLSLSLFLSQIRLYSWHLRLFQCFSQFLSLQGPLVLFQSNSGIRRSLSQQFQSNSGVPRGLFLLTSSGQLLRFGALAVALLGRGILQSLQHLRFFQCFNQFPSLQGLQIHCRIRIRIWTWTLTQTIRYSKISIGILILLANSIALDFDVFGSKFY